jgi:nucleoside phosphorylase
MSDGFDLMRTGIIVPMEEEFEAYPLLLPGLRRQDDGIWQRCLSADGQTAILLSDCGTVNAAAAAERLITTWEPDLVITSGSAGAHNPELLPGDIVIGTVYRIHDDTLYPSPAGPRLRWRAAGERVRHDQLVSEPSLVALALETASSICAQAAPWSEPAFWPAGVEPRRPRAIAGVIGSSDNWNTDRECLLQLHTSTGSQCEDMESAFIAQVCAMHDIPFLAVRCISNSELHAATGGIDVTEAIRRAGAAAARVVVAFIGAVGSGGTGGSGRWAVGSSGRGYRRMPTACPEEESID